MRLWVQQSQSNKRCNYFDVNTEGRMLEWFRSVALQANEGTGNSF